MESLEERKEEVDEGNGGHKVVGGLKLHLLLLQDEVPGLEDDVV